MVISEVDVVVSKRIAEVMESANIRQTPYALMANGVTVFIHVRV